MRIAIVGGTGAFGRALAFRFREAGYGVVIGSRDALRAASAAQELGVEGATNEDAVGSADVVVLATAADGAVATARALRQSIRETPVLSVASEFRASPNGFIPGERSLAEQLQEVLDAPVVAGLHSLAASNIRDADPPDEDALVCGDHEVAKAIALDLAERVTAGRALDAGPLANARVLEGLTAVLINLNKRYRAHVGLRVTGLR